MSGVVPFYAYMAVIHCRHIMQARKSHQYTIRGVPAEVDRALRAKARQRRISLNQLLLEGISQTSGVQQPRIKYRSLKSIAGRWQEDEEFERILKEQRQIDWSAWK